MKEDVFVVVRYALAEPKKETGSFEEQNFTFNFVAEKGLDNVIKDINNYILSKCHGEVEESDDCVSREEVNKIIHNHAFDFVNNQTTSALLRIMRDEVKNLPPGTPKQSEYKDGGDFQYEIDTLADAITFKFSDGTIKTARLGKLKEQLIKQAKQSFEGMTNGEVIKAIFKNMLYKKGDDEETICAYCYPNPHNANGEVMIFDRLWWNAPYEGGEQNETD